jgi:hypothetical protein
LANTPDTELLAVTSRTRSDYAYDTLFDLEHAQRQQHRLESALMALEAAELVRGSGPRYGKLPQWSGDL